MFFSIFPLVLETVTILCGLQKIKALPIGNALTLIILLICSMLCVNAFYRLAQLHHRSQHLLSSPHPLATLPLGLSVGVRLDKSYPDL